MEDPTSSYYLRLTEELRRRLRHRCIETGRTMNAEIIAALGKHLGAEDGHEGAQPSPERQP